MMVSVPVAQGSRGAPVRLAVFDSHPIQYHYQYYRRLAADRRIDLRVFFCLDTRDGVQDPSYGRVRWDVPVDRGYEYEVLPNVSPRPGFHFLGQVNPAVWRIVRRAWFDAVWVWGYSTLTSWLVAYLGQMHGLRVLFRGEATLLGKERHARKWVKETLLRRFLSRVDCVAYSCTENSRYYESLGVPHDRLLFVPCAVDNELFLSLHARTTREASRRDLGIPSDALVVLFVGRLEPVKRPHDAVEALARLSARGKAILLFVGDGSLREHLEEQVVSMGLSGAVRFEGFKNQTELITFYAAADVFVLPSEKDPSPKALNEAMVCGLPVVVSDRVGTAPDLVEDGVNGFVVATGDVDALVRRIKYVVADPASAARMGEASRDLVCGWTFERGARAIREWLLSGGVGR